LRMGQTNTSAMARSRATVVLHSAAGEELAWEVSPEDTGRTVKAALRSRLSGACKCMKLVHGTNVLQEDLPLQAQGVSDGAHVTIVFCALPVGTFELEEGSQPAGRNTDASVLAVFGDDATFDIALSETEITSDMEFEDYDPYAQGAAWDYRYRGTVTGEGDGTLVLAVSSREGRGLFNWGPTKIFGEMGQSEDELRLELPFSAGWCNDGRAGPTWVTLQRSSAEPVGIRTQREVRHRKARSTLPDARARGRAVRGEEGALLWTFSQSGEDVEEMAAHGAVTRKAKLCTVS